tara:strand:- start:171 stop:347 length:177 start_codon:yes stop_codon:yes gene_type:complete
MDNELKETIEDNMHRLKDYIETEISFYEKSHSVFVKVIVDDNMHKPTKTHVFSTELIN